MKKNVLILASLCALCLFTWQAQAVTIDRPSFTIINMGDNVPSGYEAINLKGKLSYCTGPDDVVAGANKNEVYLHFNHNCGNVSVSIYNADGNLVYNSVVDTSLQRTFIIPITGSSNGVFSVVLDNSVGFAEGDFDRQSH